MMLDNLFNIVRDKLLLLNTALDKLLYSCYNGVIEESHEEELSDVDKHLIKRYPCLSDDDLREYYSKWLAKMGKCPECNHRVFPDITPEDGYYQFTIRCIWDCGYTKDMSREFNRPLGLTVPGDEPKSEVKSDHRKHYVDTVAKLLMETSAPKSTGTLKKSFPDFSYNDKHSINPSFMEYLYSILPVCPECNDNSWMVTSVFVKEHLRMEATAQCRNCHCEYDITDYYALAVYGDCSPVLEEKYGVDCVDACRLKLKWSPKTKMYIGESVI